MLLLSLPPCVVFFLRLNDGVFRRRLLYVLLTIQNLLLQSQTRNDISRTTNTKYMTHQFDVPRAETLKGIMFQDDAIFLTDRGQPENPLETKTNSSACFLRSQAAEIIINKFL